MSSSPLKDESPGVQAHLNLAQAVIQRMAANSATSKGWCITLVSAILVIVAEKGKPGYLIIAGIPLLLFLGLDAYYLALERCFRQAYNAFIAKLHNGQLQFADLYALQPAGSVSKQFFCSLCSPSIWPFYVLLAALVGVTGLII